MNRESKLQRRNLGTSATQAYKIGMAKVQQTFVNQKDGPIYISVEPWPECFELEPGDRLTLIWDARTTGEMAEIAFINERELIVDPSGAIDAMQFLINGESAREKSWDFKHQ